MVLHMQHLNHLRLAFLWPSSRPFSQSFALPPKRLKWSYQIIRITSGWFPSTCTERKKEKKKLMLESNMNKSFPHSTSKEYSYNILSFLARPSLYESTTIKNVYYSEKNRCNDIRDIAVVNARYCNKIWSNKFVK